MQWGAYAVLFVSIVMLLHLHDGGIEKIKENLNIVLYSSIEYN